MLISVIIPFKNSAVTLPRCLEALAKQRHKAAEYIFVDGNSCDGSPNIINDFAAAHPDMRFKVLNEEGGTAGTARNKGVGEASGEWLAFTDADCIPSPDWLADIAAVTNAEDDSTGAIAGCILPASTTNVVAMFLGLYTLPPVMTQRYVSSYTLVDGGFPTANLVVKRSVFESVRGFDERFVGGEDHDLCRRIYSAGFKVKLVTNARVLHIHRDSLPNLLKQVYGYGKHHPLLLKTMPHGAVVIEAPCVSIVKMNVALRVWLDFNQADKKMLVAALLPFLWLPLVLLPLLYLVYLALSIRKKMGERNLPGNIGQASVMAVLLLLRSGALTAGRVRGSLQHGVLCV